jgi:pimeloyl-ACP methyl ester carboxylesterase
MRPVAQGLCERFGVLEPLQTRMSVDGQVAELRSVIIGAADRPVTLIGHSWGAWLAWLTAARHAPLAQKLILVGCGGFRPDDGNTAHTVRMERLTPQQQGEVNQLLSGLETADEEAKKPLFARFGKLFAAADAYEWIPHAPVDIEARPDIYASVWPKAAELRASGQLLAEGRKIRCPVVAIHGDYDSHPVDGVREPLQTLLTDFRFIVLPKCGHEPWFEGHARETFFRSLTEEIASAIAAG